MFHFFINNRKIFTPTSFSILEFLNFLSFEFNTIVIEYNGIILPKQLWSKTFLKPMDKLEFVTIVGGG
jgi:thiamine biosynthesis protein ThiS